MSAKEAYPESIREFHRIILLGLGAKEVRATAPISAGSTSSQVFDLACEDYSNIISILGSASIVQATVAWLRGVCGLECQAAS